MRTDAAVTTLWRFRLILCAMGIAPAAALAGCTSASGPPQKVCYAVKGQLFVKSQPAAGALVILYPQNLGMPEEWTSGFPRATVGPDGTFEAETYGVKDGAPAGEYIVLVTWPQDGFDPDSEDAELVDRLGGRYSDFGTSKLRAKVESGPTELPPIRLP